MAKNIEIRNSTAEFLIFLLEGKEDAQNGIMLADGMEYASFVESKGFDVISKPAISIKNNAEKEFSK